MKLAAPLIILMASIWLAACATPPRSAEDGQTTLPRSSDNQTNRGRPPGFGRPPAADVAQGKGKPPTTSALPVSPQKQVDRDPEPDTVVKLDPGSEKLSTEMEGRLVRIAAKARQDERIILRLESHVPDSGSSALNIGIAEKALQIVKERLQALGVLSRRILLASFGSEQEEERDMRQHWVEIYLLRPGY